MDTNREWRSDPDAETILRDIAKLPFLVDTISLGQIDWSGSANNCARLTDPLNAEKIEDYTTCMNRGDVFPRIVVERGKKKNQYVILGGNQRAAALRSIGDTESVECYVVDTLTSDERELVIRSLNSRHGWGSTKEERIEHAVYLVRKFGMHVETVARAMVVSENVIRAWIRAEDERTRLAKSGIDASRMSRRGLTSIAAIANTQYRDHVANAAIATKATGEQVSELSATVAKAGSLAKAAVAITDFRKAANAIEQVKDSRSGGKLKKPRREKFLSSLVVLSDFLERGNDGGAFSTLDELSCSTEHDLDNVRVLFAKINSRLLCICESGK